jgi:HAD superfamily hydrolase (TIGR01484 family)
MSALNYYEKELNNLAATYEAALAADITDLKVAIAGISESSIIGVGSGGSYTVASLLCSLHEAYTGRVSRPSTPLEVICNPTLASASPVFLISAEGKNPDICEALMRARRHSARTVHVICNREDSPLVTRAKGLSDVKCHIFGLPEKDGYLATNSLLFDAVLIARTYGELDLGSEIFPPTLHDLRLGDSIIQQWVEQVRRFAERATKCGAVLVTYSPLLRPIAADFESKLAESALLHCQLADLRSFAHGRHLWLSERPDDCTILALIDPPLQALWEHTASLIPKPENCLAMSLGGSTPADLIAGLVAQMHLIAALAKQVNRDPAKPTVQQFGRDLYYAAVSTLVERPSAPNNAGLQSKADVLGAHWPAKSQRIVISRALEVAREELARQEFRAIVFDYDGTLCPSQRRDAPPPAPIVAHLQRLIENGIVVGLASGRGGSMQEHLKTVIPERLWGYIHLGLYNGGWRTNLGGKLPEQEETSEFLSHVTRIARRLQSLGAPIVDIRPTPPFQVSIRFREGIATEPMWFVIADALKEAGLDLSRMVRSKHSIDVLASGVGKSLLIADIIQKHKVEPFKILTMGDQGAWPGNDAALLEHRYSLSVDIPSRRIDRGWKFAPEHKRNVDATLWYLDRINITNNTFSIEIADVSN